jgi:maltokinase
MPSRPVVTRSVLEQAVVALDRERLASARWFAGKERPIDGVVLVDAVEIPRSDGALLLVVDAVQGDDRDRYALPARLDATGALIDAGPEDPLWPALAAAIAEGGRLGGLVGCFTAVPGAVAPPASPRGRTLSADQSNTSIVLDDQVVVKCYRRLEKGVHPEPELLAGLTAVGSPRAPRFGGALFRRHAGAQEAIACVYAFVPGKPVGWEHLIERLRAALAHDDHPGLHDLVADAEAFGRATGRLHVDLAAAFGVVQATADDGTLAATAAAARLTAAIEVAADATRAVLVTARSTAEEALEGLRALAGRPLIRCHGDLHVGQLVASPDGPVVIDLEGEPGRPLEERRRHASPLRDVACLVLSLDHTAAAAARRLGFGTALRDAFAWSSEARRAALAGYASSTSEAGLPVDDGLLLAWELEKELHEVIYAATVLPEWSYAPRLALERLLERATAA